MLAQKCFNRYGSFLVIEECDVSERRKSIMVPERRNQKGWSKLESELQIAIRFFQPFLLAPGNVVVKKKSFAEVIQSTMRLRGFILAIDRTVC